MMLPVFFYELKGTVGIDSFPYHSVAALFYSCSLQRRS